LLAAQNAQIGVAQAMRFPSFSLTAMFGVGSNELSTLISADGLIWSVGGQMLGPLFNFNKNKRRVDVERERTKQMLLTYEKTVLTAFKEVEDALVEIQTYKNELRARRRQVNAAENALMLSRARYDRGVTSYLEVLESNRQLFDAELIAVQTFDEYLRAYLKLYKALGGGW
jgi:multidrug efflux system outer membrane protein